MWQEILVFAILALAGGFTLWRFHKKFTGKGSCCGGGCTCKGSCGGEPKRTEGGGDMHLRPLPGGGCGCSR